MLQLLELRELHALHLGELPLVFPDHAEDLLFGAQVLVRLLPVQALELKLQLRENQIRLGQPLHRVGLLDVVQLLPTVQNVDVQHIVRSFPLSLLAVAGSRMVGQHRLRRVQQGLAPRRRVVLRAACPCHFVRALIVRLRERAPVLPQQSVGFRLG